MATGSNKVPPALSKYKTYDDWIKTLNIWPKFSDLAKNKQQGPSVFLSLEGEAQEAVLELAEDVINSDSGLLRDKMSCIYKKDELLKKYEAWGTFETYKHSSNTSMQEFLNEFTRRYNKAKSFGTTMSDDILAYCLLNSANLSKQHQQLAKATISDLKFDTIKDQLNKIFGDLSCIPPTSSSDGVIKQNKLTIYRKTVAAIKVYTCSYSRARGAPRSRRSG